MGFVTIRVIVLYMLMFGANTSHAQTCHVLKENDLVVETRKKISKSAEAIFPRIQHSEFEYYGWVHLAFYIKGNKATNIRIINSCPLKLFDRTAKKTLEKYEFKELKEKEGQGELVIEFKDSKEL